jgi:predicted ATP-binding protein involved in virulence
MRLKTITLKNFRCFEHLEVDLHPRLTVIVGNNGTGKTALLDGIAAGLTPVLTYLSSANQRLTGRGIKDADFLVRPKNGRGGRTRWGTSDYAQITVSTYHGIQWDYWRPFGPGGQRPTEKHGEKELKDYLNTVTSSYASDSPVLTPVMAYYGANRGHIEVPKRLRTVKQNYGHPTTSLLGALDATSDFREMLAWFDQEESSELRANRGVVNDDFEESQVLAAVRASVIELLGEEYQSPQFNKDHKFLLERKADGAPLLVNQLSQGYQSMLALAMDFSRRLAIANGHLAYGNEESQHCIFAELSALSAIDPSFDATTPNPFQHALAMSAPAIMLVDEVDLHLHPMWQQRVLSDLMRTFPLTQFIVTTHSPQVLSTVKRENIRMIELTDTGYQARIPDFSPLAHESGDALAKIMETHREPPLPIQEQIRHFEQLVRTGQEDSCEAIALRQVLDQAGYQIHESDLITWRFLAARKARYQGEHT